MAVIGVNVGALTLNLGYCPPVQSILGDLLRAIYNHSIIVIQLLLRGGSTQT